MRRLLSILLLLGLVLGPALEAIPAHALASGLASGWTGKIDEASLPACCRRNGKHHCTMPVEAKSAPAQAKSAPASASAGSHATLTSDACCPCRDRNDATTVSNNGLSLAARVLLPLPVLEDSPLSPKELGTTLSAKEGKDSERGPPISSH